MPLDEMRFPGPLQGPDPQIDVEELKRFYAEEDKPTTEQIISSLPPLPLAELDFGEAGYVCVVDPGEVGYESGQRRGGIAGPEAELLSAFARRRLVIEIGTGLGVSTRAMARTAKQVHTIDVDPWVIQQVFPRVMRDCANVHCHPDDIGLPTPCDLVFVDGNHEIGSVLSDLRRAKSWVASDGLIIVHDLRLNGVRGALNKTCRFVELATHFGMAVVPAWWIQ